MTQKNTTAPHKLCQHKDRAVKMQRLYKREGNKFIPRVDVPGLWTDAKGLIDTTL